MLRRELLYAVVRDAMARSGVSAASYKFKVLSLEARGRQFLVMVDLARDHEAGGTAQLAEIEALVAQSAKVRHDILVTAVYWRMNDHVAVGDPLAARPAVPEAAPPTVAAGRFEPIGLDEVAAFRKALAGASTGEAAPAAITTPRRTAAATQPAAATGLAAAAAPGATATTFDGSGRHGPQSYTLLTGFEDTEAWDEDVRVPALSGTQYGDLT